MAVLNDGLCLSCHGAGVVEDDVQRTATIILSIDSRLEDLAAEGKAEQDEQRKIRLRRQYAFFLELRKTLVYKATH